MALPIENLDSKQLYCRICLTNSISFEYKLVSTLFNSIQTIADIISDFAQVQILDHDDYSKYICLSCLEKLKISIELRTQIKETDTKLKNRLISIIKPPESVKCVRNELLNEVDTFKAEIEIEDTKVEPFDYLNENKQILNESNELNITAVPVFSDDELGNNNEESRGRKKDKRMRNVKCPDCSQIFKTRESVKEHSLVHDSLNRYRCKQCNLGFYFKYDYDSHELTHKNSSKPSPPPDLPYKCNICEKRFKSRGHKAVHFEPKYKCDQCDRTFRWVNGFKAHQLTHTNEYLYECEMCDRKFKSFKQRSDHVRRSHTRITKVLCKICGKSVWSLGTHLKIHSKPFKCDVCDQVFGHRYALKCHQFKHSGEKLFSCELCQKTFKYYTSLFLHKRAHENEKRFACKWCEKKYLRKQNLQTHVKNNHKNVIIVVD